MRLFLAIDISSEQKKDIAYWRAQHLSVEGKQVSPDNLHITCVFLGSADEQQKQQLIAAIDQAFSPEKQTGEPHLLTLDHIGSFAKAKVIYLGNHLVPSWQYNLVEQLTHLCRQQQWQIEQRPYRSHITLLRKGKLEESISLTQTIPLFCHSFSLYWSKSTDTGVRYIPLKSWQIPSAN